MPVRMPNAHYLHQHFLVRQNLDVKNNTGIVIVSVFVKLLNIFNR